ncbi:LacI family DNA-binding transcriptional regulator [Catellatospora sp. KI3]|uniref:LacI family DNA-binding transcriptional regulator n=1 Tax=Catellatospora sp. KI3 TaxID=3041620 RepID=UPI0024827D33|nr:LacI family DNA-binding transcriptional regulator [Catellatospora sp. KI3]MDI1460825.1 LacI family DNA-binding transcriptional regulator [Catellatospora sp. KI3]
MNEGPPANARRRPATLHDVARAAGVSYATASRALNGSDRTVRAENVARVHAAAAQLGYSPHLSAQAIARGSTSTAALVVSDVDDPYFSSIAAGVTEAAEAAGLIVTMAIADRSPDLELQIVRSLRGQRPRAIVIAGSRIAGTETRAELIDELTAYRTAGGRVALISQHDLPFDTLCIDNHGGARRLALALAEQGHRTFAVIHGSDSIRTSHDRRAGFLDGLRQAGLTVDPRYSIEVPFTRDGGAAGARALLARGVEEVDVAFAVNDTMAIGAMTVFRDAGLTPGADIGVAGFDDIGSAVDVVPALTTVRIPLRELGQAAMRVALADDAAGIVQIPTEVVLRDSTPLRPRPGRS